MLFEENSLTFGNKIKDLNFSIIGTITLLSFIGFALLYSAGGGSFSPWAFSQMTKFFVGFALMIAVALLDINLLMRYAYVIYGVALVLLILVQIFGMIGMGAQRWISVGFFRLQPSEIMKIALVLTLGCYYHRLSLEDIESPRFLWVPLLLVFVPALLVLKQPDLGTAVLLIIIGVSLMFVAGVRLWYFLTAFGGLLVSMPIVWGCLKTYQKKRILTFIDPEQDPLGSGYHILQSKIALGSGGVFGKGFLKGTQSHLNFLPEKQTDFIFTMFCEEFGLIGAFVLVTLYGLLIFQCLMIAVQCRSTFTRLLAFGIGMSLFIYVFINMSMVIGLVPVVGVPLPFISYGGTSLITLMVGVGILLNADLNQSLKIPRYL
jgi:rod shape determining protein RodA